MPRTESNEAAVVSEIPYIINDENVIIAPGKEKTVLILSKKFCEQKAFSSLLSKSICLVL